MHVSRALDGDAWRVGCTAVNRMRAVREFLAKVSDPSCFQGFLGANSGIQGSETSHSEEIMIENTEIKNAEIE